ncbi:TPA: SDR family oxidoreductase [Klebsiella variicola subsp. variicola]|nr:SDR family oxidoreductase [Klebsiella variicola subsp. variicola]
MGLTTITVSNLMNLNRASSKMKNVILIGANGHTAKAIIPLLLEQSDVRLTLFLRRAARVNDRKNDRVNIVEGDATNMADLRNAISEQDIVISTLGGPDLDLKTANIVSVMKDLGTKRIIAISAGGIYDELPEPFNSWDKSIVGHYRPSGLKTAEVVEQSSLTYTVLRPVWLTDKPTEEFELTKKGEVYKGTETSRASIARFVAEVVENPDRYANENLGISQPNTDGIKPAAYR